MPRPLRVLVVEDRPRDADLVVRELRRAGFAPEWQRVDTETEYIASLRSDLDIILSDYEMPDFSALRALEVLQQSELGIPLIIISGTIGEDTAVAAMKQGAVDYLLKDRLTRLGPAVEQAVEKGRLHRERVQTVLALRESEERFREVVQNIEEVFWMTNLEKTEMLFVSAAYEKIWGRTCASLYASPMTWLEAIHPDDRDRVLDAANTRQLDGAYHEEYRIIRPDGSMRWIDDRAFPVRKADGAVYRVAGVARDITEQRELEARFLRAQRMESIGTLASGVAHDLNNILSPIMMSASLLHRDLPPEVREELVSTIELSAERGAQIVKQVLTFGRGLEGERQPMQLASVIKEVVKMLYQTFPKDVQIESALPADLWLVVGDATQLQQVILNLCVNARDAMPTGGTLRLRAGNVELDQSHASMLPGATLGPNVFLEVEDSGGGIPPEILERIFDPFFTTKGIGKGTGLGLSTALGIVKSHGGHIGVKSAVGVGTTFQIHLPATREPSSAADASQSSEGPPLGHGECVLVVDDEANVRSSVQFALEAYGYEVLLAADGTEGLALFAKHADRIAVVLADLMMPQMDGVALIHALRKTKPEIRVIASTGLGRNRQLAELEGMNIQAVLRKPYGTEALLHSIRDALAAPA